MSGMTKSTPFSNLHVSLGTGTTAVTNVAITDIATEDEIISVWHLTTAASIASAADLTSEASITSAGNIQLASSNTTDDQLVVLWSDKSDPTAMSGWKLRVSVLAGAANDTNIAVTGITTTAKIWGCLHFTTAASVASVEDKFSEVVCLSDGYIQLTTTDTSDDALLLFWSERSDPVVKQYMNLNVSFVAGAGAATNIAVTGILTEDEIISCLEFATASNIATLTDRTSWASITSNGYIQTSSATSSDQLVLFWIDKSR